MSRFVTLPSGAIGASVFNGGRFGNRGLFRSTDQGATWTDITGGFSDVNDVEVDEDGALFVATPSGVFKSQDEGSSWTRADRGIVLAHVSALGLGVEGEILVSVNGRLLREGPDGTWDRGKVTAITGGDRELFALSGHLYKEKDEYAFVHVSEDGGETWTQRDIPWPSQHYIEPIAFQSLTNGSLLLGGWGLFESANAGQSWSSHSTPNAMYRSAAPCGSGEFIAGASYGDHPGIYRSADGGTSWSEVFRQEGVLSVACSGSLMLAGATSGELFISSDDLTWSDVGRGLGRFDATDIVLTDNLRLVVGTDGGGLFEHAGAVSIAVDRPTHEGPDGLALDSNYPNPFSQSTTLAFSLSRARSVTVRIFDLLGREIRVIEHPRTSSGRHHVTLDGTGLPAGPYMVEVSTGTERRSRLITVLR